MACAPRSIRSLLIVVSLSGGACSGEQLGVHQLVLREGELQGDGLCWFLIDDVDHMIVRDANPFDSDDDFRTLYEMGDGKASISIYVRREPGHEADQPTSPPPHGKLALKIELDQDHFGGHDIKLDSFATRDGAAHSVYTWPEADCDTVHDTLPQWVLDKTAAR